MAFAMADTPALCGESVAHIDITTRLAQAKTRIASFDQSPVCDEADTMSFVGQVWPQPVIEDMVFDSLNRRGQSDNCFRFPSIFEGRGVDGHGRQVVEMRVRNQEAMKDFPEDVECVGLCTNVWKAKTCKGPFFKNLRVSCRREFL
jgi:hypothetical protein